MIGAIRRRASEHPAVAGAIALALVIVLVFLWVWFTPHKLFLDTKVDEAAPVVLTGEPTASPTATATAATQAGVVASGQFRSLEHSTKGRAILFRLSDGSAVLRLQGLDTSDGPDLRVYLSEIPASNDWRAYGERYLDLGKLRGNLGNQNYAVPKGTDLSRFKSAVIWCRRFTVGFGVAPLTSA